jgi:hypothetical protein
MLLLYSPQSLYARGLTLIVVLLTLAGITFTITSKVAVYAPAEWADTLTLFHLLYKYVLCSVHCVICTPLN